MTDDARIAESPGDAGSRPTPSFALYLGAIASALFMVRLLGAGWTTHFPAVWPDATYPNQGYLAVAGKGPFRPSFYFAFRPIGYPLLLWAVRQSSLVTVVVQTALYCAVLIALGTTGAPGPAVTGRGRASPSLAIVGIALQAKYAMWNTQILSESLAISLGFASIAAWWRFAAAPTRSRARWALGVRGRVAPGARRARAARDDRDRAGRARGGRARPQPRRRRPAHARRSGPSS